MKIHAPVAACTLFLISIGGFAAEPPAPASPAAPSLPAAIAPGSAPAPTVDAKAIASAAHSLGYKARQHEGKTIYCKSESKVGTSFQTTTCLSEDQVMATVKRAEGNRDSVEALQRAFLVGAPSKEPFVPAGNTRGQ